MNDDLKHMEPFFGSWYMVELIGEGSFGKVYKIKRETFGEEQFSALKVLQIPQNEAELKQAYNEGLDDISVTSYFDSIVKNVASEINMMVRFKGTTNIVSYEDHQIIPNENGIGATILIRMELLHSLNDVINKKTLGVNDVLRLGVDICKALEKCHANHVIHRDIKPENIFVNDDGDFKLGDFGIARQLEKTMSGLSKKGTYTYMAPEVYLGKAYSSTVDLYSLGIVMYRLLNNNRTPFLPAYPAPISFNERSDAQNKRMAGEVFPAPVNADSRLAQIVLKACAFNPAERFESPMQMREALVRLDMSENKTTPPVIAAFATEEKPESAFAEPNGAVAKAEDAANISGKTAEFVYKDKTESIFGSTQDLAADEATVSKSKTTGSNSATIGANVPLAKAKSKSKTWLISSAAVLVIVLVGFAVMNYINNNENNDFNTYEQNVAQTTSEETADLSAIATAKVGGIVKFGNYEQDNNLSNGKEPIEWRVLTIQNGKAFLLSEKILDSKPYNNYDDAADWESCSLRAWLNNDLYNDAFSSAEQEKILTSIVDNTDIIWEGTHSGNNTTDKIFLLSYAETTNPAFGFSTDDAMNDVTRRVQGTAFAQSNGVKIETDGSYVGNSNWWLRTPGYYQIYAYFADCDGSVDENESVGATYVGVRPALWINL